MTMIMMWPKSVQFIVTLAAKHQALADHWKSLNLCLKVLESAWIWFSKTPWPNQLILKKVFQMASSWPQMCIKSIFGRGEPHWRSLCRLYMLIKVPVWLISSPYIYPLYGPWKSLKSPWIWFWQMGKNPVNSINKSSEVNSLVFF